jgi:peptidoglycan-N-acetylglucosamine deacetylase
MFAKALLLGALLAGAALGKANAVEPCHGNAQALGTGRTIAVNPATLHKVGTFQFPQTIPLEDHELVLTFDDGPYPPLTNKVLDALAAECVQANFFVMGEHVKKSPELVQRAWKDGHTIGTHTETHPHLAELPLAEAEKEIRDGIAAATAALGDEGKLAPFFRAPYLETTAALDDYIWAQDLMLWGIDIDPEDWKFSSADEAVAGTLAAIEKVHKGIVLLHDVRPATAAAVPTLLRELKARGYRIVHVVPAAPSEPETVAGTDAHGSRAAEALPERNR